VKKVLIFIFFISGIVLIFTACGLIDNSYLGKDSSRVIFSLAGADNRSTESTPPDVTQVAITVSAEDMSTVSKTISAAAEEPATLVLVVKKGKDRIFKVQALNAESEVLYEGTSTMDIEEDTVNLTVEVFSLGTEVIQYFIYLANWQDDCLSYGPWDMDTGSFSIEDIHISYADSHGIGVHPNGKYAYVSTFDFVTTTITNTSICPTSGGLNYNGSSSTGTKPTSIVVHPTLPVAYVSCMEDQEVRVHSINSDGTLGAGTPASTTTPNPHRLAIHPNGKFLYVANEDNTVQVQIFSINQSNGNLSYVGSHLSSFYSSAIVPGIAIHPNGLFAYVTYTNFGPDLVICLRYSVNPDTGALSNETILLNTESSLSNVYESVDAGPLGNYLYITNTAVDQIRIYTINQSTGNITLKDTINAPGYLLHTNVAIGKVTSIQ